MNIPSKTHEDVKGIFDTMKLLLQVCRYRSGRGRQFDLI